MHIISSTSPTHGFHCQSISLSFPSSPAHPSAISAAVALAMITILPQAPINGGPLPSIHHIRPLVDIDFQVRDPRVGD
ncbi:hypothetical protein MRB53_008144 [Persea americana]|uniref:Uncharacterized protein n=1 Tax=Persea americana TaxID=3435 RepID=A0ACC2ML92_PERAE|nr:hypothetical protein MRB53_008144 [Persea americana]